MNQKTSSPSLCIPLCSAGKRHRIQSCEKPRAPFNWRLTRLVTSVAGKPLLCKCGRWHGLNLGMHVHAYAHTFFRLCKNFEILRKSGRIWDDIENIKRLTVKTERHETEGESCTGTMQTAIEQDLQSGCKDQRTANVLNRS